MAKKQKYYQRKDGLFETIRTINGKRVAFRGKTCREVDQKLLAYRGEQERGRLFPKVADEWEREHEKTVRESTRVTYRVSLQRIKAHFTGPIKEIRPMDVKRYLVAMEKEGYSASSVQVELSVLRMVFAHVVLAGDIEISPVSEVHPSKGLPKKERKPLTEEQEQLVRENWDKVPFGLFFLFLLYTGMRRGEALALSVSGQGSRLLKNVFDFFESFESFEYFEYFETLHRPSKRLFRRPAPRSGCPALTGA